MPKVQNRLSVVLPLLCGLVLPACLPPPDGARSQWLRSTLVEDNLNGLRREPEAVEGKFGRMALDPYDWLRGSLGQFRRDLAQRGPGALPTAFGDGPELLLVGDPHLENIGTFADPSGQVALEFNDFDAATYGPWIVDVRRLATSAWLTAEACGLDGGAAASSVADAYATQVTRGDSNAAHSLTAAARLVDDALARGQRGLAENAGLADFTEVDAAGRRHLKRGEFEARPLPFVVDDALVDATPDVVAGLTAALPTLIDSLAGGVAVAPEMLRVKDIARRWGSGVSSYPLLRFYILVEGPTSDLDDDWLLEAKEAPDAGRFEGLSADRFAWRFDHNAARIVSHQRTLQGRADADFLLGFVRVGPLSLRVRSLRGDQSGLSVQRLCRKVTSGEATVDDLLGVMRFAGGLLATAHARGETPSGRPAGPLLAVALLGREAAFRDEVQRFAQAYGYTSLDDFDRLRALLSAHGPRLGFVSP